MQYQHETSSVQHENQHSTRTSTVQYQCHKHESSAAIDHPCCCTTTVPVQHIISASASTSTHTSTGTGYQRTTVKQEYSDKARQRPHKLPGDERPIHRQVPAPYNFVTSLLACTGNPPGARRAEKMADPQPLRGIIRVVLCRIIQAASGSTLSDEPDSITTSSALPPASSHQHSVKRRGAGSDGHPGSGRSIEPAGDWTTCCHHPTGTHGRCSNAAGAFLDQDRQVHLGGAQRVNERLARRATNAARSSSKPGWTHSGRRAPSPSGRSAGETCVTRSATVVKPSDLGPHCLRLLTSGISAPVCVPAASSATPKGPRSSPGP